MSRLKAQGKQSETEREFCEILQMADPIVSRFVSEHETFRAENEALKERVAVLERALQEIAEAAEPRIDSAVPISAVWVRRRVQEALDG